MMKGRCRAVIISAVAALLGPLQSYSNQTGHPLKAAQENKQAGRAAGPEPQLNSTRTYTVRRGDNLGRVARTYETTIAELKRANKLQGNIIRIGQKLRIPEAKNGASKTADSKASEALPVAKDTYVIPSISAPKNTAQVPDSDAPPLRFRLVKAGFEMLGVRYRRSGGSAESGFDCSGLVKNLFSKFNIDLPHSSREQYLHGEKIDRNNLEAGDLVFFASEGKRPNHVGIYVGNNKFLHAALKARQVIISDLDKIWYAMRYLGARRITDLWGDEPSSKPRGN